MENFDKIKGFVIKCIKRKYPNDNIIFINDNDNYKLEVELLNDKSTKEQNNCVDFIEEVLKLCNLKTHINIRVNGLSRMLIRLNLISEGLGTIRMYRNGVVTPVYGGYDVGELPIYRDPIACNTDPICQ